MFSSLRALAQRPRRNAPASVQARLAHDTDARDDTLWCSCTPRVGFTVPGFRDALTSSKGLFMLKLGFYGASGEVTGSSYLISTERAQVLVDFGMHQGEVEADDHNRLMPPFAPSSLNAIVLTHAHLDHVGRMPMLIKGGYRGRIHATPATIDLSAIILKDSAHLQEADAERDNRYAARLGRPASQALYTTQDVERTLPLFSGVKYDTPSEIAPGITIRFFDAGHILGSASVHMTVRHGDNLARSTTIAFSGDVGVVGSPILRDPMTPPLADVVLLESTYGDRDHRPLDATRTEFLGVLRDALRDRGKVLIPAFAVGRTQDILYHLGSFIRLGELPEIDVVVDSPMATETSALYRRYAEVYDEPARELLRAGAKPLSFPGLRFTKSQAESVALNAMPGCRVIISASGMCTGGRIVHHLQHNLWKPETHVVIVGYQGQGTLGRRLVDGAKNVRIMGESVEVKAKIHTLGGFSAHAGQTELINWARPLAGSTNRVFLTHGEDGPRAALRDKLAPLFGFAPDLPKYGDVVQLA